jgi:hypothetical protein
MEWALRATGAGRGKPLLYTEYGEGASGMNVGKRRAVRRKARPDGEELVEVPGAAGVIAEGEGEHDSEPEETGDDD